jgi:hypothetical protein
MQCEDPQRREQRPTIATVEPQPSAKWPKAAGGQLAQCAAAALTRTDRDGSSSSYTRTTDKQISVCSLKVHQCGNVAALSQHKHAAMALIHHACQSRQNTL